MKEKKIGILDPEGKKLNPLTGKKYIDPDYYRKLASKVWTNLKVWKRAEEIIGKIRDNRVVIAEAGTGTGKTVIIPKLALHTLDYKGRVLVTVPRTALTTSSSDFASKTLGITVAEDTEADGDTVGYWHSGAKDNKGYAKNSARLVFATDGTIVNKLIANPNFEEFDIVIVDEVHERNPNIDIIIMLLRNALRVNPTLKVILMSATLPKDIFQDYFSEFEPAEIKVLAESNFPVEIKYNNRDISSNKQHEETFDFFEKNIEKKNIKGFVLWFVSGSPHKSTELINKKYPNIKTFEVSAKNAQDVDDLLKSIVKEKRTYLDYFSSLDDKNYSRLVIVSTPVWESSVTIDKLDIVIDNGYEFGKTYDLFKLCEVSETSYISKGQAKQRKGRTGRSNPGICYRLYTEKTYEKFLDDPIAPILTNNIIGDIWNFSKTIENCTLKKLIEYTNQLIQPPVVPKQKIYFKLLYDLGLFESWDENAKISKFGELVQKTDTTTELYLNVALASSVKYSCSLEMCIMAALLTQKDFESVKKLKESLFIVPPSKNDIVEDYVDKIIKKFTHPYGELFTMFKIANVYFEFATYKNNEDNFDSFVRRNKINKYRMDKVIESASGYLNKLPRDVIKEDLNLPLDDRLLYSLLTGYFFNIAKKDSEKTFMNFYPKIKSNRIAPESKFMSSPEVMKKLNYIFYIKLSKSFKTECSHVCALPARILNLLPSKQKYFIIEREPLIFKNQGDKYGKKNKKGKNFRRK